MSDTRHVPVDVLQALMSDDGQLSSAPTALPSCLKGCFQLLSLALPFEQLRLQLPALCPGLSQVLQDVLQPLMVCRLLSLHHPVNNKYMYMYIVRHLSRKLQASLQILPVLM